MRILVYSENDYGCGASIVAWMLAAEYAKLGHKVVYVFQNEHQNGATADKVKKIHFKASDINLKNKLANVYFTCWFILFAILAKLPFSKEINAFFIHRRRFYKFQKNRTICESLLKNLMEKEQFDAIHLHSVPTNLSYQFIDKISRQTPTIWTLHNCFPTKGYTTQYQNLRGKTVESYADFTFREVNSAAKGALFETNSKIHFATPSAWLHRLIKPDFSFPEKLHIIHNGLSPSAYFPKDKAAARQRLNLNPDKKYALAIIGKLHLEHKNFTILNEAFQQITDPNIELILIGNQGNWTIPFPKNILFQGPIFEEATKSDYLCAADLFIIPSLADNFPTVILESLFCGTPILGANIGGIPEMVIPEKTGRLFSPYQAKELTQKIKTLINDDALLKKMSRNCIAMSQAKFTLNHQAKQHLKLLQKIKIDHE
jgi:glycosyltransferase involved in cell wall biosynthesis